MLHRVFVSNVQVVSESISSEKFEANVILSLQAGYRIAYAVLFCEDY